MQVNLVFLKKDGTIQSFPLPSDVTFIGRRQDCDLCIPLPMVSRRHCQIYTEQGNLMVRDLHSRNGILLNDQPVEEARIKAGDVLKIGPIRFVFQIDGKPDSFEQYFQPPHAPSIQPQAAPVRLERPQPSDLEKPQGLAALAGQSQTMDMDGVLSDDIFTEEDFDLDSDLPA
ncbi:MAG: FHA domain-containing protein [Phycisphaerae bacterium]|nr:FHA domain-containing protein [Phycisphaerae bacterium]